MICTRSGRKDTWVCIGTALHSPPLTVTVDYDRPLSNALAAGKYGFVDHDICEQNFPVTRHGRIALDMIRVKFLWRATTDEVLAYFEQRQLRAADLPELLEFLEQYPHLDRERWTETRYVVALGSVFNDRNIHTLAPSIDRAAGLRNLELVRISRPCFAYPHDLDTSFLAVRDNR